jgi:hypothetical protein
MAPLLPLCWFYKTVQISNNLQVIEKTNNFQRIFFGWLDRGLSIFHEKKGHNFRNTNHLVTPHIDILQTICTLSLIVFFSNSITNFTKILTLTKTTHQSLMLDFL